MERSHCRLANDKLNEIVQSDGYDILPQQSFFDNMYISLSYSSYSVKLIIFVLVDQLIYLLISLFRIMFLLVASVYLVFDGKIFPYFLVGRVS